MAVRSSELHNNHNVYILGAGFSRPRGLPLISDFMLQMRDALEYHARQGHVREVRAIEEILDFRLKASAAAYRINLDLENIEELFSLASASKGRFDQQARLAIAATLDYATNQWPDPTAEFIGDDRWVDEYLPNWVNSSQGFMGDGRPRYLWKGPAYEYIVKALIGWDKQTQYENTFITFNYDTLLEEALTGLGMEFSLGFDETKTGREKQIGVYKLHGSVNWGIAKSDRSRITVFDNYRSLVEQGIDPLVIPPTWKKDTKAAFEVIWDKSLHAIKNATRIVVIGFSIPPSDMHFKYLLAAGMQENFSLRNLVFVSSEPGATQIMERCQALLPEQFKRSGLKILQTPVQEFVNASGIGRLDEIGRSFESEYGVTIRCVRG